MTDPVRRQADRPLDEPPRNTSSELQTAAHIRTYFKAQPPAARTALKKIRDAIRAVAPDAGLRGYETSKGTVRFPLDKPLPLALVKKLVRARVDDVRKA